MFSIRFFNKFQKGNGFLKFVNDYCVSCCSTIEKEDTNEEHIHAIIKSNFCKSTLRKNFLKLVVNGNGNKVYSIKKCDTPEKALRYICKEKPPKKYILKGYTENDIKQFHVDYWNENNRLKKKHQIKGSPYFIQIFTRLKDNEKLKHQVLEWCKNKKYGLIPKFLEKVVIKSYITDCKTFPNKYQITNVANSLMSRLLLHYKILINQITEIMHAIIMADDPYILDSEPVHDQILNYLKI